MTVIVAARTGNHITIAADRQVTLGWTTERHSEPKVWTDGQWAIGGAGHLRDLQVMKHHVTWPRYRPDEDTDFEKFLVKQVVPATRNGASGHGITRSSNGIETIGATLLLATGSQLAIIASDGGIVAPPSGRIAIGSGHSEALGALGDTGPWSREDVIEAVRRSCITAYGVGGPINVVDTDTLTVEVAS